MTRLSADDSCAVCGSLLVPPELASGYRVPARTDYVCLKCGQPYRWTSGNPPRLTALVVAGGKDAESADEFHASVPSVEPLIVMAEDHDDTREMYARFLEDHGFRIAEGRDGAIAVELTERLQPSLVVMNVWMPTLDGISAIRRIRAQQELRDIPILVLTSDHSHDIEALTAGATAFCKKPCTPDALLAQVRALLERAS